MKYPRIKNEEILPFVTAHMEFKGMLSEISPTETNIVWPHLYVESERKKLIKNDSMGRKVRGRWSNDTNFQL